MKYSATCGHCGVLFEQTNAQHFHQKKRQHKTYCSPSCRSAGRSTRPVNTGPCPTCGERFASKTSRTYCSLSCYIKSDAYKEQRKENTLKASQKAAIERGDDPSLCGLPKYCLECNEKISQPWKKKYCNQSCYRAYMAKRFDRWIADPQTIALPQGYDEFLDQEILPCLVEGCEWKGKFLTGHMNATHGVPAAEFKRAAGFNLTSGIISSDLRKAFEADRAGWGQDNLVPGPAGRSPGGYQSLEGKEHLLKAREIMLSSPGPQRKCRNCSKGFIQSQPCGKTLYCSSHCREAYYRRRRREKAT